MALHLVADDLTGTLDAAAQFCGAAGPVPVLPRLSRLRAGWQAGPAALNIACRDGPRGQAIAAAERSAAFLAAGDPAFKKIDSLLRGHWAAELAAVLRAGFASCVLAPAFPAQGRLTIDGQVWLRSDSGTPVAIGPPLREALAAEGIRIAGGPGDGPSDAPAVHVFDAASQEDLARVVVLGRTLPGPVLWCGSAGLAAALAGREPPRPVPGPLVPPVLILVGTDHPVTRGQLDSVLRLRPAAAVTLGAAPEADRTAIATALDTGHAIATFAVPEGADRADAARFIARGCDALLRGVPSPAHLVVAGGETLMAVCDALDVEGLTVVGEVSPGIPVSHMTGGPWDGTRVISKSGAFGEARLLASMLFG